LSWQKINLMPCVKFMLWYELKLWHLRFYHNEVPKNKSSFQWVKKISQLLSWCKSKPWCLRLACHNLKKSHVTCEIHVIMKAQTITFEVLSQWSLPKISLHFNGCKMCHIDIKNLLNVNGYTYVMICW
jgi:hypothetical protein